MCLKQSGSKGNTNKKMPVQYCTGNVMRCYVFLIIIKKNSYKTQITKRIYGLADKNASNKI